MKIFFVVATVVFAAVKSGTVKFLNADSLSRILNFITAVVKGELEITMLPEMIGREVRFDFSQSNIILFFVIIICICASYLILQKILHHLFSDHHIRDHYGKLQRIKHAFRKIRYFFQRVFFFFRKHAFRLFVYVSSGVFPASEFKSDISFTVADKKKRYYGGLKAGTGRPPMVKLNRLSVFSGTKEVSFQKAIQEKGFIAAYRDGAVLHFSRDVETAQGTTHLVRIGRGESKPIRFQSGVKVSFAVSRFKFSGNGEDMEAWENDPESGSIVFRNYLKEGF